MKKAQASTEYLVILAVVIVVAAIVAGLMSGFISLSGGTSDRQARLYWKTAEIGIMDWKMQSDGVDSLAILNNQDYEMYVVNITVGGVMRSINETFAPGDTKTLNVEWVECKKGDSYSYPVTFLYDNKHFNMTGKLFTGDEKLVGECQ